MIHLRPLPDAVEFLFEKTGLMYKGKYHYFSSAKVKMIRELYSHEGQWVAVWKLAKVAGLKIGCVKVFIGKLRPIFNEMGYKLENYPEIGYRIKRMDARK